MYADDIILTVDDFPEIKNLKKQFPSQFETKDLGQFKKFLGMKVARSKEGIKVSQRKNQLDILKEIGMSGCRSAKIPIDPNIKFRNEEGNSIDQSQYQRLVGKLIYLSHTRPDMTFVVSLVSQIYALSEGGSPRSGLHDSKIFEKLAMERIVLQKLSR